MNARIELRLGKVKLIIGVALVVKVAIVPERQRLLLAAEIFVGVSSGLIS